MGLRTLLLVSAVLVGGLAYVFMSFIPPVPSLPDVENAWWGEGDPKPEDKTITPFTIQISDEILDDLHERLELTSRAPPPLEGTQFQYGFNSDYLQKVVDYWMNEYSWRDREAKLNQYPQFKTKIAGLNVHFLHVKPKPSDAEGRRVLPLLLLHGWPGSIVEFQKIIPMLTSPRAGESIIFEVIAPSLPGYGFSEGAHRPGLGAVEMAPLFRKLMERLGHDKFYAQGGDWGAIITSHMATLYKDSILGIHMNMCYVDSPLATLKLILGSFYPTLFMSEDFAQLVYPLGPRFAFILEEMGYLHIQATKPDTVGIALNDSPSGLAAYILEKFSTWTNASWRGLPDGGLSHYSMDELLDNVMTYWVTGSITTSVRLYSETMNKKQYALEMGRIPTDVPTSCAAFPNEIMTQPEWIVRDKYTNLVTYSLKPRGGHFAAFEVPDILAEDIWLSVSHMENKRVKGTLEKDDEKKPLRTVSEKVLKKQKNEEFKTEKKQTKQEVKKDATEKKPSEAKQKQEQKASVPPPKKTTVPPAKSNTVPPTKPNTVPPTKPNTVPPTKPNIVPPAKPNTVPQSRNAVEKQ